MTTLTPPAPEGTGTGVHGEDWSNIHASDCEVRRMREIAWCMSC